MPSFDYDAAVTGSRLGGSVAALGAAKEDYRVGVREAANSDEGIDAFEIHTNTYVSINTFVL